MGQASVDRVIEIMRGVAQKEIAARQAQIEQQRADQQGEQEKARIKQQQDELKQRKSEFDSQHALAQKAADFIHNQQMTAAAQKYQETGLQPAGTTINPAISTMPNGEANASPVNPVNATSQVMGFEGTPQTIPVQSPTQYATSQAKLQEITNKPMEDLRIRIEAAKQKEIEQAKAEGKAADLDRMNAQKQYDDARAKQAADAAFAREKYKVDADNRTRLQIANISKGSTDVDLTPYISQANNGEITQEDIKKLPLKPVDQMKVLNGVVSSGGRVLKEASKQNLTDMATVSTAIPHIADALNLLKTNPIAVRTPGTDAYKQYQEAVNQAELVLPQVARIIGGEKGKMSNQQISYAQGSFIPTRNPIAASYETNVKNAQDFVKTMNDIVKNHTVGMSPEHVNMLKENFGIKPLVLAPGGGTAQQVPVTQPQASQLNPTAIQFLKQLNLPLPGGVQ